MASVSSGNRGDPNNVHIIILLKVFGIDLSYIHDRKQKRLDTKPRSSYNFVNI